VARNLDRLQNDPQRAPLREVEEGLQDDALHSTPDGATRNCYDACRGALVVQASALYGAELWWDDRKGSGVKNRCDEFRTTNWYSPDERPPLQALLQVESPTGRDVGEGQGGDEEGEAEVARGRPTGG